ncbi:MAG: tyrosine-type recombinase/integrase [Eubacterium sp.]|nr:tyrosine-type recombinase/integrase [Eubacterium sp.]
MIALENGNGQLIERGRIVGGRKLSLEYRENTSSEDSFCFYEADWYLYEYAPGKEQNVRRIHLHFSDMAGQQTGYLVRQYAAWRLGRVRPVTVRLELDTRISHWLRYLRVRRITDPEKFGAAEFMRFGQWLHMQGIREDVCERILSTVNRLLLTGQKLGWLVTADELQGESRRAEEKLPSLDWDTCLTAATAGKLTAVGATEPIPKEICEQILQHALVDEADEVTRAGIIIQSQTGLRISEVLSLKEDCLKKDRNGEWWLMYSLKKTTKAEPEQWRVPANRMVREAVERLRAATEMLRRESGRTELFLVRNHGIRPVSQTNWNKGRLRSFLKRWEITDENGQVYELHSHQFRATYVRDQLLAGAQIEQIRHRFGHVSPEMTARYIHLQEEEMTALLTPYMAVVGR